MPNLNEEPWGTGSPQGRGREGVFAWVLASAGSTLEAESERWFLWLPVLFATGILTYFALPDEPDIRVADIVIVPFSIRKARKARVVVDRRMLKAQGAHALYIEGL